MVIFLIPAPALADDHSEPKTSLPEEAADFCAAGLDKELLLDWRDGLAPRDESGAVVVLRAGTDVK